MVANGKLTDNDEAVIIRRLVAGKAVGKLQRPRMMSDTMHDLVVAGMVMEKVEGDLLRRPTMRGLEALIHWQEENGVDVPTIKFKDLQVGATFRFMGEIAYPGMARGPWRKTSPRCYERVSDGLKCKVGSINAEVKIVAE